MRLSSAARKAGSLIILAALLAGCSDAPPNSQSLPPSPSSMTPGFGSHPDVGTEILNGGLTPLKLLELQGEGKLPSWLPPSLVQQMIEARMAPRPHLAVHQDAGRVAVWASNGRNDYLIGMSKWHKTVAVIDTASNGCQLPFTVKVDHERNVWTACALNGSTLNPSTGGAVQEYSRAGFLKKSYSGAPPCNPRAGCTYAFAYINDGGRFGEHVFGALSLAGVHVCSSGNCAWQYFTGFIYWEAANPSGKIKEVSLPAPGVQSVGFMDFDKYGNIWFDYYGCQNRESCGYALGEITKPTSPSFGFNIILTPRSFDSCPEGIYVSEQGGAETLNVTDTCNREIYQYHMPVTPQSKPIGILGPTPTDRDGYGEPLSGGFNKTDTSVAQADAYGWLDIGNIDADQWKAAANLDTVPSLLGAAYTPSDK